MANIKEYLNERNSILFIVLITTAILLSPVALRFLNNNTMLIGDKAYYHARIGKLVSEKGIPEHDELSYSGREYIFNPYHLVVSFFTNVETASKILVFLAGISSAVLFFFILKEIKVNIKQRLLIILVLVLSPAFIYTFSVSNIYALSVLFLMTGMYCLAKKRLFFSGFFLIAASFFSLFNVLLAIIFLLGCLIRKKDRKVMFITAAVLIIFLIYYVPFYSSHGLPEKLEFISINPLQQLISGLGSMIGFSIFALMLAIIGFSVSWKRKKEFVFVYAAMFFLMVMSFYLPYSNIYLNFFICMFAGIGLYSIIKRRWEIRLIMHLTILALICGLLFSSVSYINRLVSMKPDENIKEGLEWLNSYSDVDEVVLSHYSNGAFIEYWAERPVVMDSLFSYSPEPNERYNDSMTIFNSRNLKKTKKLLDSYNVKYLFIDNEMKTGLVWQEEKQGLLFLLRNNETFKNIYNRNGIEIWKVKEEE